MRRLTAFALLVIACGFLAARAAAGRAATTGRESDLEELRQAAATLAAELSAAKREGLPLAPADLYPGGPVTADENAGPLYRQLEEKWHATPAGEAEDELFRTTPGQGLTTALGRVVSGKANDAERRLVHTALRERAPLLVLAEQIARRPRCRFGLEWEKGDDMDLPPFSAMRLAAHLLAARAVLTADDGRWEDAFTDLERCAVVVRHAGEDPLLIMFLVQVALVRAADTGFRQVLRASAGDLRVFARARRVHEALSAHPDLVRALHGEMLFARMALRRPGKQLGGSADREEDPHRRQEAQALARFPEALLRDAFEARVVAYYRRLIAALAKGGHDVPAMKRHADAVVAAEVARKGPSYWGTREITGVTGNVALSFGRAVALQRLREGLLALLEARRRTGAFPESLPNPPLDPFDGKPLRYRRRGEGFILSSIGSKIKDDGGNSGPWFPELVITYP